MATFQEFQSQAKALLILIPAIQNYYVLTLICLSISIFFFQQYINIRQHRKLSEKKIPEKIRKIVKPEEFEKSRLYSLDKSNFTFISECFGLLNLAYFLFQLYLLFIVRLFSF